MVHTEATTQMTIADTSVMDMTVTTDFTIAVTDTTDDYVVTYLQSEDLMDMEVHTSNALMDSGASFAEAMIMELVQTLEKTEFNIRVSKETGLAYELIDEEKYLDMMKVLMEDIIEEMGVLYDKSSAEILETKLNISSYLRNNRVQIVESMVNSLNMLIQPHSYLFKLDGVVSNEILVYEPNLLGEFGGVDFPAVITLESETQGDMLKLTTSKAYDTEFLITEIRKKHPAALEYEAQDLRIIETEEVLFDLNTTWILQYDLEVYFETPDFSTTQRSVTTLK